MLLLLLVWALVTAVSVIVLLLFLAVDEWQVRRHRAVAQPTTSRPSPQDGTPQAA